MPCFFRTFGLDPRRGLRHQGCRAQRRTALAHGEDSPARRPRVTHHRRGDADGVDVELFEGQIAVGVLLPRPVVGLPVVLQVHPRVEEREIQPEPPVMPLHPHLRCRPGIAAPEDAQQPPLGFALGVQVRADPPHLRGAVGPTEVRQTVVQAVKVHQPLEARVVPGHTDAGAVIGGGGADEQPLGDQHRDVVPAGAVVFGDDGADDGELHVGHLPVARRRDVVRHVRREALDLQQPQSHRPADVRPFAGTPHHGGDALLLGMAAAADAVFAPARADQQSAAQPTVDHGRVAPHGDQVPA